MFRDFSAEKANLLPFRSYAVGNDNHNDNYIMIVFEKRAFYFFDYNIVYTQI